MEKELIVTGSGAELLVEQRVLKSGVEVTISEKEPRGAILHWGLTIGLHNGWVIPPENTWPYGTSLFKNSALQTPFSSAEKKHSISVRLDAANDYRTINFALFFPDENRWDSNSGKNYSILLPVSGRKFASPIQLLESMGGEPLYGKEYSIETEKMAVRVSSFKESLTVCFATTIPGDLKLHWGVSRSGSREWFFPPEKLIKCPKSAPAGEKALQTPFTWKESFNQLEISISGTHEFSGIYFILKADAHERWIKNVNRDFYASLRGFSGGDSPFDSDELAEATETITDAEVGRNSWTLMHRFDLCSTLLDSTGKSREMAALLFVWLRFSAIRQLDWQRNYNTQPRALAHSQDRLTLKISDSFKDDRENRDIYRLLLATLGPGGEGQKIRDEILHIMHRHRIKEVSGHFMEEWHQKLHNNTTPDDIVICEAYIEFLKSDGNQDVFYYTLERGGVDRVRLASFERPIVTSPDFVPHLKHGLIHDFENYLRLFKSVHAGNDLEVAIQNARGHLDHGMNELLSAVWHHRLKGAMSHRVELVTEAGERLKKILSCEKNTGKIRALLYLDLALEELLRKIVEGNIHLGLDLDDLIKLIGLCLKNICMTCEGKEFKVLLKHWIALSGEAVKESEWALNANSVLERAGRITGEYLDGYYTLFQPMAENLGKGFDVEEWSITCFSEEILRGHSAFVLSSLIHHLDPVLRKMAKLGEWQIVSRGEGEGYLRFYDTLRSIQGKRFDLPTVLLVNEVKGDEDIPDGVTAVITPNSVDLVSHVAVRVRNTGVLFATCYNDSILSDLRQKENSLVGAHVSSSGDVKIDSIDSNTVINKNRHEKALEPNIVKRKFSDWALSLEEISSETSGGKSLHLSELAKGLPDWIRIPESVVTPFGVFDRVLEQSGLKNKYETFLGNLETDAETARGELFSLVKGVPANEKVIMALKGKMERSGFSEPFDPALLWSSIKSVWASVWSKTAFESRKKYHFPHNAVSMAVLVQQVVPAEYAFVIHTVNPLTDSRDELFAEVVPGLGETLVGSHPGRAFGFSAVKSGKRHRVISFPSKSYSLRGSGIICRSDSNAEDLGEYSGAGVYDSILLEPPQKHVNDYLADPLVIDPKFRNEIVEKITKIAVIVEKYFESPQDIEGVFSQGSWYVVQSRPQTGTF